MRPEFIGHICPHCGIDLVPRETVEVNADPDEWVCGAACNEGMFFDWSADQMTDVLGPGYPPWPTKGATFAQLQAEIARALGGAA